MSVVVVGSANLDTVYRLDSIPSPGETVLATGSDAVPGGKGNNQAVAAARAGAAVSFVVALGTDAAGDALAAAAREAGIRLHARRVDEPTGTAVIMVDRRAENAIVVDSGANRSLVDLDEDELALVAGADVLLLQLETPMSTVAAAAAHAHASGTTVVLNAAPARPVPPGVLDVVDVLIVNEHEAAVVAEEENGRAGDASHHDLAARLTGRGSAVIVTLGARGALVAVPGEPPVHVPGFPVTAVDTTGAGDTFCGALAAALDREESGRDLRVLLRAAEFATAAAALSVQRPGAVPSIPTLEEIDDFRASH